MSRKMKLYDYLLLLVILALFGVWLYTRQNWLRYAVWAGCGVYLFRRMWVAYKVAKSRSSER